MLPKIFLTALFATTYVAAMAVPQADGDALVVRADAQPVEAIVEVRAETEAVVGDELDADKVKGDKKGKGGKGKKGKGGKGKGAKGKGKGKKGKGKGEGRKGKGEGRKGDRDGDEA